MLITVRFLLLATAAVALREAGEEGESTSNSIGETKSDAEVAVASFNAARWTGNQEFGDLKAFQILMTLQCPPDNLEDLHKEQSSFAEELRHQAKGVHLFHAFTSESHPDKVTLAAVIADKVAYEHFVKLNSYRKWIDTLRRLDARIMSVKFIGDPDFGENIKASMFGRSNNDDWKPVFWNQTSGFARSPTEGKKDNHGKTFIIEAIFEVPNDNLPTINVLNTAFMASQFDWDPTCFFARVCFNPEHDGDSTLFTYGGVYLRGFRPWGQAVEFGEGKSEANWVATAAKYGAQIVQNNIYGSDSQSFKNKMKQLGSNLTTFWDFNYGFDRYKENRYMD